MENLTIDLSKKPTHQITINLTKRQIKIVKEALDFAAWQYREGGSDPESHIKLLNRLSKGLSLKAKKIPKNPIKLYQFSTDKTVQFAYSTLSGEEARGFGERWDHGGYNADDFYDCWQNGICQEINCIEDLNPLADKQTKEWSNNSQTVLDILPYCADEEFEEDYYFDIECSIGYFLGHKDEDHWWKELE